MLQQPTENRTETGDVCKLDDYVLPYQRLLDIRRTRLSRLSTVGVQQSRTQLLLENVNF